jgi:hypothetical protein
MNPKRIAIIAAGSAAMFLAAVAATCGDTTNRIENPGGGQATGITVAGEGKATGKPDIALITLVFRGWPSRWTKPARRLASLDAMVIDDRKRIRRTTSRRSSSASAGVRLQQQQADARAASA